MYMSSLGDARNVRILHPLQKPLRFTMLLESTPSDESNCDSSFLAEENNSQTKEELENDLALIEALEERNKAQIYSFIDEEDQWNSMEESERQLLLSKDLVLSRLKKYERSR